MLLHRPNSINKIINGMCDSSHIMDSVDWFDSANQSVQIASVWTSVASVSDIRDALTFLNKRSK